MYSVFVQLCEKKGVSTYKVCKDLGISQGTISNWKNRGNNLSTSILKKIADYFEVSVDVFFNDIDWNPKTQEITEIDDYYVDENAREYADFLHKNPEYKVLFDASRKVKSEDLQKALKAIGIFIDEE